jgi:hypothetical protein
MNEELFPGLILMGQVEVFRIRKINHAHIGRKRVLIHKTQRDGAKRHQIVRLMTQNGKYIFAEVIGVEQGKKGSIGLDLDDRELLGLGKGDEVRIEVRKCGLLGQTYWFVSNNDPSIRIAAILAICSVLLGILSIVLAFKTGS